MAQDITAGATHLTANGHLPFPPEVRNIIYGHIFAPPQDPDNLETVMFGNNFVNGQRCWLKLDGQHAHYSLQPPDLPPFNEEVLSLLLVSKQTYLETFHMFYETNEFGFCTIDLLTQFLRRIGYARRQYITRVAFVWRGSDPGSASGLLQSCTRLRSLRFNMPLTVSFPQILELRKIRGLQTVTLFGICTMNDHDQVCRSPENYWIQSPYAANWESSPIKRDMQRPRLKYHILDSEEVTVPFGSKPDKDD